MKQTVYETPTVRYCAEGKCVRKKPKTLLQKLLALSVIKLFKR